MSGRLAWIVAATTIATAPAAAHVTEVVSNGFTLEQTAVISAAPDKVYAMLVEPARWWSRDHTFSGSAANLKLEPRPGGCFCENFPAGGGVQHLVVLNATPGKSLRLQGMLGPFQAVAGNGVLTFTLAPGKTDTTLKMNYQLAGYADMKIAGKGYDVWSKAADGMLSEQLARLKKTIETGSAD